MGKADNQGKAKEDEKREALAYLERPTIYIGSATTPKPPSRVIVWLRSILGRRAKF
jgi:hypothetical protein